MKLGCQELGRLLEAASRTAKDLARVRALLSPDETLRMFPLEITYREMNGDRLPRRTRLWNTFGHLFLEGEYWDHDGGRFWREVVPICRIEHAHRLQIPIELSELQVGFAESLRDIDDADARRQHQSLRLPIHWAIESELTRVSQRYPLGQWPDVVGDDAELPRRSRAGVVEVWLDAADVASTALRTAGPDAALQGTVARPGSPAGAARELLRETLSGQAASLTYNITAKDHDGSPRFTLGETFVSDKFRHQIAWRYPLETPPNRDALKGVYLPLDTLQVMLEDQISWSHWSWAPSTDHADLGTLCRSIHRSGDFGSIRNYLGSGASPAWHDAVSAACKLDCFALIATCALHPDRNFQISRRLLLGRVRTSYFRLFFNGGVLVGTILKHAWALGWAKRSTLPQTCTADFSAVTGRRASAIPAS